MGKNLISGAIFISTLITSGLFLRAEIKVGIQLPTTGSEATYGMDVENAIKLAAEEVNAKGGVLGQKIVTFTADTGCDPQMASAAAAKLLSNGVVAVVGGYCSGADLATLQQYADAGVPYIICCSNSSKFTTMNPGCAFLINSLANFQVDTAMALFKKEGVKKIALVHEGDGYSEDLASLTRTKWQAMGQEVVAYQMVSKGEQDMSALVTQLQSKKPDMIFWTAYYADGALLVKQLRQFGYQGKIIVGDGCTDAQFIKIGGKATEGVFNLSNPLPEFLPKGKDFIAKYKARYHTNPGAYSALGYDGMMLFADALRRANSIDHKALTAAIKATKNYPGLSGKISFDNNNNLAASNFVVLQVKNGEFKLFM